jgi:hypothetical protein
LAHAFKALSLNPADIYNPNGLASIISGLGLSRVVPPTSNPFSGLEEAAALVPCPILNRIDRCIIIAQVPLSTISLSFAILTKVLAAKRFLVEVAILNVRLDDSKLSLTAPDSGLSEGWRTVLEWVANFFGNGDKLFRRHTKDPGKRLKRRAGSRLHMNATNANMHIGALNL